MKEKLIAFVMVLAFLVMSLSACSKNVNEQDKKVNSDKSIINHKDNTDAVATMGRYMEKEVELPKTEGNEAIVKILQNNDQKFEIFTFNPTNSGYEYYCYREADNMTWEKSKPQWLNTSQLQDSRMIISDLCMDADGHYYAIFSSYGETAKSMVFYSEDEASVQSIDIPYLEEPVQNMNGVDYYPRLNKIYILKNGNMVVQDLWKPNTLLIFDRKGKKADEIMTGQAPNYMVYDNYVITMNEEGKIILYNSETKRIDNTFEYITDGSDTLGQISYAIKKDGSLTIGDSMGIHRISVESSLWETVVDGALNSMSMPTLIISALFIREGTKDEYFIVYSDEKGFKFKKYVFDHSVSSIPDKEITIYSLTESNTIRQAISLFQAQNSDVKVNYIVDMREEGERAIDYIHALNTELLSENGADILVLDDLPVESYIEKGILADISDIFKPLASSGNLVKGIQENYLTEDKVYQMPIRFSVPLVVGKADVLKSAYCLQSTVDYIKSNNGLPYAAPTSPSQLIRDYLALEMDTLISDGKLQKEQLTLFLRNMKELETNILTSENNVNYAGVSIASASAGGVSVIRNSDNLFQGNMFGVGNEYTTGIRQINNVSDIILPSSIIRDNGLAYSTLGDRFIPKGLIGLNSTSKEIELSKQFIRFLFSEEIQNTNLYDGLPVLLSSLQNWFDEDNPNIKMGFSNNGKIITASWPEKEEREEYLNRILSVNKPIISNQIINDMIKEHALLYLAEEEDIEKAAAAISSKVETYLAE
jgi:hypothetical protein